MSDKSSLQTDEAVKEPMDTQSEFGEKMILDRKEMLHFLLKDLRFSPGILRFPRRTGS